jgi:hypothetical protein
VADPAAFENTEFTEFTRKTLSSFRALSVISAFSAFHPPHARLPAASGRVGALEIWRRFRKFSDSPPLPLSRKRKQHAWALRATTEAPLCGDTEIHGILRKCPVGVAKA